MPQRKFVFRLIAVAATLGCLAGAGRASGPAHSPSTVEFLYHSVIPLGSESFSVQPWNTVLTVLASAQNPGFEGWRREWIGERSRLVDAAGSKVRFFPGHVDFRVTLGTRTAFVDDPPFPLRAALPVNDYLLRVHFRLKIFHGLRQTIVPASSIAMIGVPADIPYDERIYLVSFDLDDISMKDRVVLEVLTPSGDRLCKFHLDLS